MRKCYLPYLLRGDQELGEQNCTSLSPCSFPFTSLHCSRLLQFLILNSLFRFLYPPPRAVHPKGITFSISYRAFDLEYIVPPWHWRNAIGGPFTPQSLRQRRSNADLIRLFLAEPQQVAHEQVYAQGTPAVPLDPGVDIVDGSPFARCDGPAIFSGDTRDSSILVQFPAVCTTVRSIDKAIRQLGSIQRHLSCCGCSYQRHDDGRPGERSPA